MRENILRLGLVMALIVGLLLMVSGCAKEPVIKQDVSGISQTDKTAQAPSEGTDTGELAKLGKAVSEEATPPKGDAAKRLGYFVVSTPNGDYTFYDVHFDYDKYNLSAEDREALSKYAKWFGENPKYVVLIEGHCDDRGTVEYNLALGERRAEAVSKYLIDLGVGAARIKTVSYGEEFPLDAAQTEDAYAKNRRAHFIVSLSK